MTKIAARASLALMLALVALVAGPAGASRADPAQPQAPAEPSPKVCPDDLQPRDHDCLTPLDYRLSFGSTDGPGVGLGDVIDDPGKAFEKLGGWLVISLESIGHYVMFMIFVVLAYMALLILKIVVKLDWINPLVTAIEKVSDGLHAKMGDAFIFEMFTGGAAVTAAALVLSKRVGNATRAGRSIIVAGFTFGVGMMITFPVAEAAKLLGLGRDIAGNVEEVSTGKANNDVTTVIVEKLVRVRAQQWNFHANLDKLGCGGDWSAAQASGNRAAIQQAILKCPDGKNLAAYAADPGGAYNLAFLHLLSGIITFGLILFIAFLMGRIAGAAVVHGGMIKPGLVASGFQSGQRFIVKNFLHGGVSMLQFFAYVLLILLIGDILAMLAEGEGDGPMGEALATLLIVGFSAGARRAINNMSQLPERGAARVVDGDGASQGGADLDGGGAFGGFAVGAAMAHKYAQGRSTRKSGQSQSGATGQGGDEHDEHQHHDHHGVENLAMLLPEAEAAELTLAAAGGARSGGHGHGGGRAAVEEAARRYQAGRQTHPEPRSSRTNSPQQVAPMDLAPARAGATARGWAATSNTAPPARSHTQSRRADHAPKTERDQKFFDLRESGYTGPVDQDGNPAIHQADEPATATGLQSPQDLARRYRSGPSQ